MSATTAARLVAQRRPFGDIPAAAWDALADSTPWASPFSRHCVQRAWWDAYGATAHDQTLVIVDEAASAATNPVASAATNPAASAATNPGASAATNPVASAATNPAALETLVGIVPLMHRHELEPGDVAARTTLRHQAGPPL